MRVKKTALLPLSLLLCLPFLAVGQASMTLRTTKIIEHSAHPSFSSLVKNVSEPEEEFGTTLSVAPDFDTKLLRDAGVKVGTSVNGVVTVRATASQLASLANISGVTFIDADNRIHPNLDMAVKSIKGDSVQMGLGLPQAFTGKGVIVGVIDDGFDVNHPTFYNPAGDILRIVRLWDQKDNTGENAHPYGYGREYTQQSDIKQLSCISTKGTHGTHVAGIAAGSGGKGKTFVGVAPEAEIVVVQLNKAITSEMIDGLSYIFNYAKSVGKPAVVNLSYGTHFGPHDGTSSFDAAVDKLVGPGKILVGSAGNEGGDKLHASHTFTSLYDTVRTVIKITPSKKANVCAWMGETDHVMWGLEVWDMVTKRRLTTVNAFYSTKYDYSKKVDKTLLYNNNQDTITVNAAGYKLAYGKERGVVDVTVRNTNQDKYGVVLALKGATLGGRVHLWNYGAWDGDNHRDAELSALYDNASWLNGNVECTVGEIGGTAKKIITVGAYVSKQKWSSLFDGDGWSYGVGDSGKIASFSSCGPTADGRVKPDLIAPGSALVASVNSCDPLSDAWRCTLVDSVMERGREYYYAAMQGTSMAAPMVAGAVALLLQQRPNLTPDNIKNILQQSAVVDDYIASEPETVRGAGKLNILAAMQSKIATSSGRIPWTAEEDKALYAIAPNPNNGTFRVEAADNVFVNVNVYSLSGVLLYATSTQTNNDISLPFLPQGLYLVQVVGSKPEAKKMLIYR